MKRHPALTLSVAIALGFSLALPVNAAELLNASYDVTREFYKDYNPAFAAYWKKKTGEDLTIQQSHGGSSKQARAVAEDWQKQFKHNSAPYTSTVIYLVRKGNPKGIKDWNDLVKPGISVVIPNPKTSGNGRYTYLAAWSYGLQKGGNEATAADFVSKLFRNVPVLDTGGRGATTTFAQRGIGDVLVTFENEAFLTQKELGADQFDIVYPSLSFRAEPPVAVVNKYAAKHGTEKQARAYLDYLYSPEAQQIVAKHFLRPGNPAVLKQHASLFKPLKLVGIDAFGGWQKAQSVHFADGGKFDQIYVPAKP